jgi:poly(A) polymerase
MINTEIRILLPKVIGQLRTIVEGDVQVYLVGGIVRDAILGRKTHDIDVAMQGDVESVSRKLSDSLNGVFYPLDIERGTYRVLYTGEDGEREIIDIALLRGKDIVEDLHSRDFTINAIALNVREPDILIDPFNGVGDIKNKRICACSENIFTDDPIRVLRAVRLASTLGFRIDYETKKYLKDAVTFLSQVSAERIRDELFRLFGGKKPATSIETLDALGILQYLLPELEPLKRLEQSTPHISDVWSHSLNTVRNLDTLLDVLSLENDPSAITNWYDGFVSLKLGRYREKLHEHNIEYSSIDRTYRSLMVFAALYHDVGKKETWNRDETGRIRFIKHELVGSDLIRKRADLLRLSKSEIDRLEVIIRNHLRPILLASSDVELSRKAIYRFFRSCGPQGVDVCLLALADVKAIYGTTLPHDIWIHQVNTVKQLLDSWWDQNQEVVAPPKLLSGNDLINIFTLEQGPAIGQLLEDLREAQAMGIITNREDALSFIGERIEEMEYRR